MLQFLSFAVDPFGFVYINCRISLANWERSEWKKTQAEKTDTCKEKHSNVLQQTIATIHDGKELLSSKRNLR